MCLCCSLTNAATGAYTPVRPLFNPHIKLTCWSVGTERPPQRAEEAWPRPAASHSASRRSAGQRTHPATAQSEAEHAALAVVFADRDTDTRKSQKQKRGGRKPRTLSAKQMADAAAAVAALADELPAPPGVTAAPLAAPAAAGSDGATAATMTAASGGDGVVVVSLRTHGTGERLSWNSRAATDESRRTSSNVAAGEPQEQPQQEQQQQPVRPQPQQQPQQEQEQREHEQQQQADSAMPGVEATAHATGAVVSAAPTSDADALSGDHGATDAGSAAAVPEPDARTM